MEDQNSFQSSRTTFRDQDHQLHRGLHRRLIVLTLQSANIIRYRSNFRSPITTRIRILITVFCSHFQQDTKRMMLLSSELNPCFRKWMRSTLISCSGSEFSDCVCCLNEIEFWLLNAGFSYSRNANREIRVVEILFNESLNPKPQFSTPFQPFQPIQQQPIQPNYNEALLYKLKTHFPNVSVDIIKQNLIK